MVIKDIAQIIGGNTQSIETIRPQLGRVSGTFPQLRTRVDFIKIKSHVIIRERKIKAGNLVMVLDHPDFGKLDTNTLGGTAYDPSTIICQRFWFWDATVHFDRGVSSPNVNTIGGQIQLTL